MNEEESNECCICFEDKTNKAQVLTKCKHNFCLKCFLKHVQKHNFCPYCRDRILSDEEHKELYPRQHESNHNWSNFPNINFDDIHPSIQPPNQYVDNYINTIINNTIDNNTNEINLFGWRLNEINNLNEFLSNENVP